MIEEEDDTFFREAMAKRHKLAMEAICECYDDIRKGCHEEDKIPKRHEYVGNGRVNFLIAENRTLKVEVASLRETLKDAEASNKRLSEKLHCLSSDGIRSSAGVFNIVLSVIICLLIVAYVTK